MAWFVLALTVPMWRWLTYRVFFTDGGRAEVGLGGWIVMTLMFAAVAGILFLLGYRKLPAYIIQGDD